MCDVCCAESVLKDGTEAFDWNNDPKAPKGMVIHVAARGKGAEAKPCEVRIRRKGTRWSAWFKTDNLAGVMGALGTDVKWAFVPKTTKRYLAGEMPVRDLVGIIVEQQAHAEDMVRDIEKIERRVRRARRKRPEFKGEG